MNQLIKQSLINTSGAALYIFGVSQIMAHGESLFGQDNSLTPFAILLLFSLSAAVVGSLVFGQAFMLFLENKKAEGLKAAAYSIAILGLYTLAMLSLVAIL